MKPGRSLLGLTGLPISVGWETSESRRAEFRNQMRSVIRTRLAAKLFAAAVINRLFNQLLERRGQ